MKIFYFKKNCTIYDIEKWSKQAKCHIRLCNLAISDGDLTIGTLRKLQTNLGHLKRFRTIIQNLSKSGKGLTINKKKEVIE